MDEETLRAELNACLVEPMLSSPPLEPSARPLHTLGPPGVVRVAHRYLRSPAMQIAWRSISHGRFGLEFAQDHRIACVKQRFEAFTDDLDCPPECA